MINTHCDLNFQTAIKKGGIKLNKRSCNINYKL